MSAQARTTLSCQDDDQVWYENSDCWTCHGMFLGSVVCGFDIDTTLSQP